MAYLLLFTAAFVAFALSAVSGGGAGLLLLPLIGLVVPAAQVPAALSLGTAASALSRSLVFRRHIRWDVVAWFVPAAIPATALGAWLLSRVQPLWIELLLGLFLAANIVTLFRKSENRPSTKLPRPVLLAVGAGAGLLSGFTGAVGVVFNKLYLRIGLTKEQIVATRGANEILLHLVKIALYASLGLLGLEAMKVGLLIASAAVLSSIVARPLVGVVAEPVFRKLNYAAMGVAGIAMLGSAGSALAAQYQVHLSGSLASGVEARLAVRDQAIAFEWKNGKPPAIERTLAPASVPEDVLETAEDMREGTAGAPVRYEAVHSLAGLSYEIHVAGKTRQMVVTD